MATDEGMDSTALKEKLHQRGETHDSPSYIRLHRALSWLARAEREAGDPDSQFIFLWIAFNAAYAQEFEADEETRKQLRGFFDLLVSLDREGRIHSLLLRKYSGPIRTLTSNRFVFEPFWRAMREHDASEQWKESFQASARKAVQALLDQKVKEVLSVVFDRLYVLRNQLIHGGATWNSQLNRSQVKDGASILLELVPIIIDLMVENPDERFGSIMYPPSG
jgi:hypothetical protein